MRGCILRRVARALALLVVLLVARAAVAHGDMHEQIADATKQIEAEPAGSKKLPFLYYQRGELQRQHGAWAEAEADFNAAERLDPQRADEKLRDLDLSRGRLYLDWNRPAQAKTALDRYLARWGNNPEALMNHARALVALGWGIEAVDHMDKAITGLGQPEPDHYLMRAETLVKLGRKHLPRAIRGLDEGIKQLGPIVTLETRAIELELELSRWDAALRRVDVLLKQQARQDLWLARRGDILERAGRPTQARRAREQALAAIDRLPPTIRAHKTTAELHQRLVRSLAQ
jgi:tetratricopeptide (TPR) repeat protein